MTSVKRVRNKGVHAEKYETFTVLSSLLVRRTKNTKRGTTRKLYPKDILKLIVTNTINICLFLCYSCPFLIIIFLNVSIVATPIDTIFNFFWMAYQFIWICLCFRVPRIVILMWDPTTTGKLQLRNQTVKRHCYLIDFLSLTIPKHLWLKIWEIYCILLICLFNT